MKNARNPLPRKNDTKQETQLPKQTSLDRFSLIKRKQKRKHKTQPPSNEPAKAKNSTKLLSYLQLNGEISKKNEKCLPIKIDEQENRTKQ